MDCEHNIVKEKITCYIEIVVSRYNGIIDKDIKIIEPDDMTFVCGECGKELEWDGKKEWYKTKTRRITITTPEFREKRYEVYAFKDIIDILKEEYNLNITDDDKEKIITSWVMAGITEYKGYKIKEETEHENEENVDNECEEELDEESE